MSALRLGVDAFNLAADRRGMGRVVRTALQALEQTGQAEVRYIARVPEPGALTPRDLARARLDAVWYPWNGMRFPPHAPAIVSINDPFAFTYPHPNPIARWREQSPIRRAIRKADCIFTISKWGAAELQRLFHVDADRIRTFYPAPDPFWRPVEVPQDRSPYMLFVGGPDARKNAAMLLQAYESAFSGGGPELVVAGSLAPADEERVRTLRVPVRRDQPSDERLRELYAGALAVLVPSLAEGFGLPVVEAMACGAAVIASNASALPEAAGDAAVLVPPNDANAWTQALERVARDRVLRESLRERGFARVRILSPGAIAGGLLECARRLRETAR